MNTVGRCLWFVLACSVELAGQVVHGRVTTADNAALSHALVRLASSDAGFWTVTDAHGAYRLPVAPGTYTMHVQRIGFARVTAGTIVVASGQRIERDVHMTALPIGLDTVVIPSRARCTALDRGSMTADAWEQARAAFAAARVMAGDPVLSAVFSRSERLVDARGRGERLLSSRRDSGFVRQGWSSLPLDSLHRAGYVQQHADGMVSWFAPDLDALLSETFIRDHCFRLTREGNLVGIRFEPASARDRIPEIQGTVWLDAGTSELRRMEFGYVHVPFAKGGEAGGDMDFVRLANGGWAIARWSIRMPVFAERRRGSSGVPGDVPRTERIHVETRIASGQLALVMLGKDTLYTAGRGVVAAARPGPVIEPLRAVTGDTARHAQALPQVTTAAPAIVSEFEVRRRAGGGQYLTRADFDKAPTRAFADFMAALPTVRLSRADGHIWVTNGRGQAVFSPREPESARRMSRGSRRACYSDVWIDGHLVYGKSADDPLFDINTLSASDIEGIEFYASGLMTPAKFQRNGAECGSLLIWLRQK